MISALILTKDEEMNLPGCLASLKWCDDVHVYDSYSSDATSAIARSAGATVTQRAFDDWSTHQNWGLTNLPFKYPWVLYVDADEQVSPSLASSAIAAVGRRELYVAYRVRRRDIFQGKWLKHTQSTLFYTRLFRPEKLRYKRLVNPVSIADGPVGQLDGHLEHRPFSKGIANWVERHNAYSTLEAREIVSNKSGALLSENLFSMARALASQDAAKRRFHQKELFYKLPARPFVKFFLLYAVKRGFLDGGPGFTYAVLQAFYEYMIVLKTKQLQSGIDAHPASQPAAV